MGVYKDEYGMSKSPNFREHTASMNEWSINSQMNTLFGETNLRGICVGGTLNPAHPITTRNLVVEDNLKNVAWKSIVG